MKTLQRIADALERIANALESAQSNEAFLVNGISGGHIDVHLVDGNGNDKE